MFVCVHAHKHLTMTSCMFCWAGYTLSAKHVLVYCERNSLVYDRCVRRSATHLQVTGPKVTKRASSPHERHCGLGTNPAFTIALAPQQYVCHEIAQINSVVAGLFVLMRWFTIIHTHAPHLHRNHTPHKHLLPVSIKLY